MTYESFNSLRETVIKLSSLLTDQKYFDRHVLLKKKLKHIKNKECSINTSKRDQTFLKLYL